jgi:hypothetical protein
MMQATGPNPKYVLLCRHGRSCTPAPPTLSQRTNAGQLTHTPLSCPNPWAQAAILLTLGLQQREVSDLQQELNLPSNQVLALFNKAIRKLHGHLRAAKEAAVERQLPRPPPRATPAAAAQAGTPCREGLGAASPC